MDVLKSYFTFALSYAFGSSQAVENVFNAQGNNSNANTIPRNRFKGRQGSIVHDAWYIDGFYKLKIYMWVFQPDKIQDV